MIFFLLSSAFPSSCMQAVPRVEIVDERGLRTSDKFYKSGSTIELKCVISKIPQPTSYVTWKHGLRMLNYDTSRGGIRYLNCIKTKLKACMCISRYKSSFLRLVREFISWEVFSFISRNPFFMGYGITFCETMRKFSFH